MYFCRNFLSKLAIQRASTHTTSLLWCQSIIGIRPNLISVRDAIFEMPILHHIHLRTFSENMTKKNSNNIYINNLLYCKYLGHLKIIDGNKNIFFMSMPS